MVKVDSRSGAGMKQVHAMIQEACRDKIERDKKRGIKNRPGPRHGGGNPPMWGNPHLSTVSQEKHVRKQETSRELPEENSGIRLNKNVELLDTPGILWPKFEDQKVGERLACIGSIKDDLLNMEELALILITYLKERYPGALEKRYGVSEGGEALAVMEEIAKVRGCVKKGDELDYAKTAGIIFDDFRSGKNRGVSLWNGRSRKYENSKRNHRRIRNASMRRTGRAVPDLSGRSAKRRTETTGTLPEKG